MFLMSMCVYGDKVFIDKQFLRAASSVSCFCLWLKCFYWLTLFDSYAHFINLIGNTITDIQTFMIMLLLILFAFANFFFTMNKSTLDNKDHLVPTYVGSQVVDSVI